MLALSLYPDMVQPPCGRAGHAVGGIRMRSRTRSPSGVWMPVPIRPDTRADRERRLVGATEDKEPRDHAHL